jgi:hypothetical protein
MPDDTRQLLERSGEPWYLLAPAEGRVPWLAERGRVTRHGVVLVNLVVGYGSTEDQRWVKTGTWDYGISGPVPGSENGPELDEDNVADRLALAAAELPPGLGSRDPEETHRRLQATRAAVAWEAAELRIDGQAHAARRSTIGAHQMTYSTAVGRCVFVQSRGGPAPIDLVSCTDLDTYDELVRDWPEDPRG